MIGAVLLTLNVAISTPAGSYSPTAASASPLAAGPVISAGGVLNGADYTPEIAPGMMVSIFGQDLAARTTAAQAAPLPTELDGVSVEVTEPGKSPVRAPLYFVSPAQINIQMPFGIAAASIQVRVRTAQGLSDPATVAIVPRAPRLFTRSMDGKGEAIALHALDYRLAGETSPAEPGGYLILYVTGLGEVRPASTLGHPGGDGGRLGPLNEVTEKVEVTLGGKSAAVLFAGLAPGLVGVYQVNLQTPADLSFGRQTVIVRVGQRSSQANVWLLVGINRKPEEIVQAALQAQARGDLAAMTELCAMDRFGEAARQKSLELLETVRRFASFEDFRFTHLAASVGDQGTLAVVRAKVSYTITTRDGRYPLEYGLLALLRKLGGSWKLESIVPDELLNLELAEKARGPAGPAGFRAAQALDLSTLNRMINEAMAGGYIDETKLGWAIGSGAVGQVPVVGDALANLYQFVDTIKNLGEAGKEVYNYGWEGLAWLKLKQVGMGIWQIVTEPVPGLDMQSDLVQASLEQLAHNLEIARGLNELKLALRGRPLDSIKLNPRLYLLPAFQYNYPAGIEVYGDDQTRHSYETPLASIAFTAPTVLGKHMPFQVIGELAIGADSGAYAVAEKLGALKRGETYYLPVDVTYLAEADASTGDTVLEGYGRYRTASSLSRVVNWDVTCRRGAQMLRVRLRNGETTVAIRVLNRYMNQVTELRLPGVPDTGLSLSVGERRGGLKVIGFSPYLEERFWPDLTNRPECLTMGIDSSSVARLERANEAAVTGVSAGTTTLRLLLRGSASEAAVKDLSKDVPVRVDPALLPELHKTARISGQVTAYHVVRRQDGTLSLIPKAPPSIRAPNMLVTDFSYPSCLSIRARWSERNFEYAGSCSTGGQAPINWVFRITGTLDPSGTLIETATFTETQSSGNPAQPEINEFTVRNVPFKSFPGGTGACRDAVFSVTGPVVRDHVSAVKFSMPGYTYVSTEWDRASHVPSLEIRFLCPR